MDGLKFKASEKFKIMWGKWIIIGGVMCALITFIFSAVSGLLPYANMTHDINQTGEDSRLHYIVLTQGFYNLKFWTNSLAPNFNGISLSVEGIVVIVFAALSVLLPLLGMIKAQNKPFLKIENRIFRWFLVFVVIMGLLMMTAIFVGVPKCKHDVNNIYSSVYFKGGISYDPSIPGGFANFKLIPSNNYWILSGLTIAGALAIFVVGTYCTRKMFFRHALHDQQTHRYNKKK